VSLRATVNLIVIYMYKNPTVFGCLFSASFPGSLFFLGVEEVNAGDEVGLSTLWKAKCLHSSICRHTKIAEILQMSE